MHETSPEASYMCGIWHEAEEGEARGGRINPEPEKGKERFTPRRDQQRQAQEQGGQRAEQGGHLPGTHVARSLAAVCVHNYESWLEPGKHPKTQASPLRGSFGEPPLDGWYRDNKLPSDKNQSWTIQRQTGQLTSKHFSFSAW